MSLTGKKSLFRMIAQRPAKQNSRRYQAQAIRAFLVDNRLLASEYKETWVVRGLMADDEAFDFLKFLFVTNTKKFGNNRFMVKRSRKRNANLIIDGGKISIDRVTIKNKRKYRFSISYGGEYRADHRRGGVYYKHKASLKDVRAIFESGHYGQVLSAVQAAVDYTKTITEPGNKVRVDTSLYYDYDILNIKKQISREIKAYSKARLLYYYKKKHFSDVSVQSKQERYELGEVIEAIMSEFEADWHSGNLPDHILDFSDKQLKGWYYYQFGHYKMFKKWRFMEERDGDFGLLDKLHGHWLFSKEQTEELHNRLVPIHSEFIDDYTDFLKETDPDFKPKPRTEYKWGFRRLQLVYEYQTEVIQDIKAQNDKEDSWWSFKKSIVARFDKEIYNNEALLKKWVDTIGSDYKSLKDNPREKYKQVIKFLSETRAGDVMVKNKKLRKIFRDFNSLVFS